MPPGTHRRGRARNPEAVRHDNQPMDARQPHQGMGGRVPFVYAAHEHTEPFVDFAVTPGAAAQTFGPFDVPAYGYARHIFIEVTTNTAGTLGTGVLGADYPFNIFQQIYYQDVNGGWIYGPIDGYAALWTNIAGGYAFQMDPRRSPWYSATIVNTAFPLRIPLEISHHDGLGSLANQSAAAAYKVGFTINPFSSIMGTVGTATAPVLRVRCYLEAWSLPEEHDISGRPQADAPPALGTTQYWSYNTKPVTVGNNTLLLPRQGNLLRNLVVIARNATAGTPRDDTVFPNPVTLQWDGRNMLTDTQNYRVQLMFERLNNLLTRDAGVFIWNFNHSVDNLAGDDSPALWWPTVQATRLEIDGVAATAGTVQVITNDIAPGEVHPHERFTENSRTGFHPEVGRYNPAAM